MPQVSVVIPTYKRAEAVGNAIASVLSQTYQDFEILVVDDASGDATGQVVERFREPRIRYLLQPANRGDAAARNVGIEQARGPFVAFLDDDDEWLPAKLSLQVEFLRGSSPAIGGVHTARLTIDRLRGTERVDCLSKRDRKPRPGVSVTTSAMMVRRACFDTVGMFDEKIPFCSDYDMWMRLCKVYGLGYIATPLVKYYVNAGSLSHNYSKMSKGEALLLEKHRDRFAEYPDVLADRLLRLGVLYCSAGDVSRGRRALWRAVRLKPLEGRNYFNIALSFLGPRGFTGAKALKDRLRGQPAK